MSLKIEKKYNPNLSVKIQNQKTDVYLEIMMMETVDKRVESRVRVAQPNHKQIKVVRGLDILDTNR